MYFPLSNYKKGGAVEKVLFSEKIPSISTWLLPLHLHTDTKRTQLNLKSSFPNFGPLASLQIIKGTLGRASALLSYKLTPTKINIQHMCLLHLFAMVPNRETSPIFDYPQIRWFKDFSTLPNYCKWPYIYDVHREGGGRGRKTSHIFWHFIAFKQ